MSSPVFVPIVAGFSNWLWAVWLNLLMFTGNGCAKYQPWLPSKSEIQLLQENCKRRKIAINSTIGKHFQKFSRTPLLYLHTLSQFVQCIVIWTYLMSFSSFSLYEDLCPFSVPPLNSISCSPLNLIHGLEFQDGTFSFHLNCFSISACLGCPGFLLPSGLNWVTTPGSFL